MGGTVKLASQKKILTSVIFVVVTIVVVGVIALQIFTNQLTHYFVKQKEADLPEIVQDIANEHLNSVTDINDFKDQEVIHHFYEMHHDLSILPEILGVKILNEQGVLLWTNFEYVTYYSEENRSSSTVRSADAIGSVHEIDDVQEALEVGVVYEVSKETYRSIYGAESLAEIYIPFVLLNGQRGVVNVYFDEAVVAGNIARIKIWIAGWLGLLIALVSLLLLGEFRRLNNQIIAQSVQLRRYSKGLENEVDEHKTKLAITTERYKVLVDLLPEAVFMTDKKGNFLFANERAFELSGYTQKDVDKGLNAFIFFSPRDKFRALKVFRSALKGEDTYINEYVIKTKSGKQFPVLIHSRGIFEDNKAVGVQGIIVDVSSQKEITKKIEAEESRFRNLFNNMSNGVAIYNAVLDGKDFVFKDINIAAEKIDDVKKNKIIGKKVTEVFPGVRKMGLLDVLRRVYKTGRSENLPTAEYKDDRISSWRENHVYKLETGEVVAVYQDKTEQKQVEDKIRISEEKYRDLFTNMASGFAYCKMIYNDLGEPVDWIYEDVNTAFTNVSGLKKEKILGNPVSKAIPGILENNGELLNIYGDVVKTGKSKHFEMFIEPLKQWLSILVYRPREGYFVALFEDVSKDKETQKQIERLAILPELDPFMIVEVNLSGVVTYMNPSAKLGITGGLPLIQKNNILNSEIWNDVKSEISSLGHSSEIEIDGHTILYKSVRIENEDKLLIYLEDRTEQAKLTKEVGQLDLLKSRFITALTHVARTPLNEVRWAIESIISGELGDVNKGQETMLRKALESEGEVLDIIDNMNTTLDIERSSLHIEKAKTSLQSLSRSVLGSMEIECDVRGVTCRMDASKKSTDTIEVDAEKIRTAIRMLVDNGIKYSKKGGTVRLQFSQTKKEAVVKVVDDGIGIPKAEQGHIFERFFRASNAQITYPNGIGLGLYIAKAIVEKHGGSVGFTSEEGKGSTFWIKLPLTK